MKKQTKKSVVKKQPKPVQRKPVKTLEVSSPAVTKEFALVLQSEQPTAGKATRQGHLPFQPGELITRHFKGADIEVKVLKDGFLYAGKEYKSLTAVAVAITGYSVSGPAFFKVK